jgi:hypothetical protein
MKPHCRTPVAADTRGASATMIVADRMNAKGANQRTGFNIALQPYPARDQASKPLGTAAPLDDFQKD